MTTVTNRAACEYNKPRNKKAVCMMRYRKSGNSRGRCSCAIAFSAGLLAASCCSAKLLIVLLAVAVIILGCLK